jgi:hypothetical protein
MAFGSKKLKENVSKPKGGIQKKIRPGNHTCKVNNISTKDVVWKGVPKLLLNLHLETEPIGEDFEGFLIDKDNPKLGRHTGQIARIKSSGWGYDDQRKDKDGNIITKEDSVVMFLDSLCHEANGSTWVKDAIVNDTYKTLEDFIAGFNKENPIKDVFLHFCLGGTQDVNDDGYPVYFLQLPKHEKGFRLYANDNNKDSLLPYNASEHLYVKNSPAPVQQFAGNDEEESSTATSPIAEPEDAIDFKVETDSEVPFEMDAEVEDDFSVEE